MYTVEQKGEALKLYHELGAVTETVRRLGYPTRELLHKWIREEGMPPKRRKPLEPANTPEHPRNPPASVKLSIIKRCFEHGESVKSAAEETGCTRASIYQWRKRYLKEGAAGLMNTKNIQPGKQGGRDGIEEKDREIQELREQACQMRLELDILKETINVVKKDRGIDGLSLKNREKAAAINALRGMYPLPDLLAGLDMPKSSFYYQENAGKRPDKYRDLRERIPELFSENKERYGYRRIHALLRNEGADRFRKGSEAHHAGGGLCVKTRKHRKHSSYKGESTPAVPDGIQRDFHADAPNQKWLTDITEFALPAGKVYLSPIVGCFDGFLPCWKIGTSPDAELVNTMLDDAVRLLGEGGHPIVHSDRGCHYRWPGWIERMEKAGLTRSMSRKGCSPGNSACEGVFGRVKNKMFYNRDWAGVGTGEFMGILDQYLIWYNEKRIKKSLGHMSPLGYRRSLGLAA